MSAADWAACPRCVRRARLRRAEDLKAAAASYGNVDEAAYLENIGSIADVDPDNYITFRAADEIYGAETGVITVDYSGSCGVCGLELNFDSEHPIPGLARQEAS